MQKITTTVKLGPQLPHDMVGLIMASWVHSTSYSDPTLWNNIHIPGKFPGPQIISTFGISSVP